MLYLLPSHVVAKKQRVERPLQVSSWFPLNHAQLPLLRPGASSLGSCLLCPRLRVLETALSQSRVSQGPSYSGVPACSRGVFPRQVIQGFGDKSVFGGYRGSYMTTELRLERRRKQAGPLYWLPRSLYVVVLIFLFFNWTALIQPFDLSKLPFCLLYKPV